MKKICNRTTGTGIKPEDSRIARLEQDFERELAYASDLRDEAFEERDTLHAKNKALEQRLLELQAEHESIQSEAENALSGTVEQQTVRAGSTLPTEATEGLRSAMLIELAERLVEAERKRDWLEDALQSVLGIFHDALQALLDEAAGEINAEREKTTALENLAKREGLTYIALSWLKLLYRRGEEAYFDRRPIIRVIRASEERSDLKEERCNGFG